MTYRSEPKHIKTIKCYLFVTVNAYTPVTTEFHADIRNLTNITLWQSKPLDNHIIENTQLPDDRQESPILYIKCPADNPCNELAIYTHFPPKNMPEFTLLISYQPDLTSNEHHKVLKFSMVYIRYMELCSITGKTKLCILCQLHCTNAYAYHC